MTPKQRVLEAISHRAPGRVPVTNRFTPDIAKQLGEIVGVPEADTLDLEVALGHDMLCTKEIGISNTYKPECNALDGHEYFDDFGIVKKRIPYGVTCTILEGSEMLRGMSRILTDMYENPEFVHELMDSRMHYHFEVGKKLIGLGVDILYIGDDAGMQQNMLLSPDLWRTFLKPCYDYLFQEWKTIRSDIIFAFHTDGHVEPIVPDFVEIGLVILNPVQPGCMDDRRMTREFGDRVTLWGGINVQRTIPFGTAAEVVAEVRDRIQTFGPGGGFIFSPSHNVQPNVRSMDNTLAYYWVYGLFGDSKGHEPAVKASCDETGVSVFTVNDLQQFNDPTRFDSKREEIQTIMDVAATLACTRIVLCPVNDPDGARTADEQHADLVSALTACVSFFRDHGMIGLMEPLGFAICSLRYKKQAASRISESGQTDVYRLVHETFHQYLSGESDVFPEETSIVHVSGVTARKPVEELTEEDRVLVNKNDDIDKRLQVAELRNRSCGAEVCFKPFSGEVQDLPETVVKTDLARTVEFLVVSN